ncbi:type 2 lantipeptide synthetase LanM family protein [Archangium violaceum]|uniref:type 2 lanthipeptide synthetase LanM family protein n=1 Tax=Archangium violaceum TaxID=83451 RepID=UPI00193B25CF|nr:type 2 lanthipeptide synthetase LanM family protein [Archangium violaceum]QRK06010.1 type 2 lantipeptide synthetase LanM family protein [Archangium violaceum]
MSPTPEPVWYRALTLLERAATLPASSAEAPPPVDAELAGKRLKRWRSQPPMDQDETFARRLANDGLTDARFLQLLGTPPEVLQARSGEVPRWVRDFLRALARHGEPLPELPLPESVRRRPDHGFLAAVAPLVHEGLERLRAGLRGLLERYPAAPFSLETAEATLFAPLPAELLQLLGRTLVLELNVARLEEKLEGTTAQERFTSFVRRLKDPASVRALFEEYTVLARRLSQQVDTWVEVSLELMERLCADWEALRRTLSPGREPGRLVRVRTGVGDVHRGGRSVRMLVFESGLHVVYKPRSLAIDAHFQQLLAWLDRRGNPTPFRRLEVLDRHTYGWMEFAETAPCETEEQVARFYERLGSLLALLYALEATDFHFQNIVASGEHPVLVDLESLLHPRLPVVDARSADQARQEMFESVLRVGMLPQRVWANAESAGIDISGLAELSGQVSPRAVPRMEGTGTDQMHIARKRQVMPGGHNRPTLKGQSVDTLRQTDALLAGFTRMYELLRTERDALLAEDGPLWHMSDDEVRVLMRPTLLYTSLLEDSLHPDVMRDALDRDRFLDRLWTDTTRFPFIPLIVRAERESLERGDVPLFTTRPGSRDVWAGPDARIPGLFEEEGLALVRRRLAGFGAEDLERQTWLIRASMATLVPDVDSPGVTYPLSEGSAPATPDRLIAAAVTLGDRLLELVPLEPGARAAYGLSLGRERRWVLGPLGLDLYAGLPGIALFLGQLESMAGTGRHGEAARRLVAVVLHRLEQEHEPLTSAGGFDGWGGIVYVLTQLGARWGREDLLRKAEALATEHLPALVDADTGHGILSGTAGALLVLVALQRTAPSPRVLELARRCGERLLNPKAPVEADLARGSDGTALALLELSSLTGEERFRVAAREALATGNERRFGPGETSWCQGSSGAGLVRLHALHHGESNVREALEAALETVRAHGFGQNHSLCHGDLGALELLLRAREAPGGERWAPELERRSASVLESLERRGCLGGVPFGLEMPGLMHGLAGTGHGLLRLARPEQVPSVLLLEGPIKDSRD